jgi:hypothetical protein
MTIRMLRPLSVVLALSALVISACNNSSTTTPTPVRTATPTAKPTPTPTPTPTSSPASGSTTEPIVPGTANTFPTVSGYGGTVTFPAGSAPASGDTITLSTALSLPAGFPTGIPSGPGIIGTGATPVAPWLSFTVAQTVSVPSSGVITFSFLLGVPPSVGQYFFAVYDLTASPTTPLATGLVSFSSAPPRRRGALLRGMMHVRSQQSGNMIIAGHEYYLGLFFAPTATSTESINPAGGTFTIPPVSSFAGSVNYPTNNAPANSTATFTTSAVDITGIAPAPPAGTPIFYIYIQLASTATQIQFNTGSAGGTLNAPAFVASKQFSLYGWVIISSAPVLFYQFGPVSPIGGTISYTSPVNGALVPVGPLAIIEVVQN